jgi:hypothetical protein
VRKALAGFKKWCGCYAVSCSKENCSAETYLADLKIGKTGLGLFSKGLDVAPTNLFNNRSKGLELAGFQKLRAK